GTKSARPPRSTREEAKNWLHEPILLISSAILAGHPEHVARAIIVRAPAGHEQEVRQAVHILDRGVGNRLVGPGGEFHHHSFRPTPNGAGEVEGGGRRGSPGA